MVMLTHEVRPVGADELREEMRLLALSEGWYLDELERMTLLEGNSITAQRLATAILHALLRQAAEDLHAQHQAEHQAEGQDHASTQP